MQVLNRLKMELSNQEYFIDKTYSMFVRYQNLGVLCAEIR